MTASRQASDGPDTRRQAVPEPNPRLEPLLWLQLLGVGAIAGESLGLLVILGSVDPGPLPGLERLLIWALGALGPAVLLWQKPADPWSLLLLQAPLRGRRDIQRRLMRLQDQPALRWLPLLGAAVLLPAVWAIDQAGGLATGLSPLASSSRLVVLLLSIPLLALIVWQWQQVWQALWLLSRPPGAILAAEPLTTTEQEQQRLRAGLPLLLLAPLQGASPARAAQAVRRPEAVQEPSEPAIANDLSKAPETASTGALPAAALQAAAEALSPPVPGLEAPVAEAREDLTTVGRPAADPELESGAQPTVSDEASSATPQETEPLGLDAETPGSNAEAALETPAAGADPGPEQEEEDFNAATPQADASDGPSAPATTLSGPGAIEPEQAAADGQGSDLDQQVVDLDA